MHFDFNSIYSSTPLSGDSNSGYSTILGGTNCSISSWAYYNVSGLPNSNSVFENTKRNINTSLVSAIHPALQNKKIKLRYNHACASANDMWKLYVDNDVYIVGQVNFQVPTSTTLDFDEEKKDYKAHVSCNAKSVRFESLPDEHGTIIIATIS